VDPITIEAGEGTRTTSTFVTVLAWVFIVTAGFSTAISVLRNIVSSTVTPLDQIRSPSGPGADKIPPMAL